MKKIPVLDTIRYGYAFTFGHLGTIIGLIWLPMLILAIPSYFVALHYYTVFPDAVAQGNPAAIGQTVLIVMLWSVASILLSAIMYAAVARQALGLRHGPAAVHFALGAPELRVFGAIVGLAALAFMLLILYGAAVAAIKALGGEPAAALGGLFLFLALFYALVRLSFLLIAATVAEDSVGLGRAWELSRGNFWRIVAVGIATLGPALLVVMLAQMAILGPNFYLHQPLAPPGDEAAQLREMAEQMRAAAQHLPALSGLTFVLAPLLIGLGLAPSAFAYRALTAPENKQPS